MPQQANTALAAQAEPVKKDLRKSVLHVGCGRKTIADKPPFAGRGWREIRYDIDESVNPDVTGTMTDMSGVETGSVDLVYSSHNIEHLYPHEVRIALKEFLRVLNRGGVAVITCPDLQSVAAEVAEGRLVEPLYEAPAGPISPLDILYGHRASMARGNLFMAHKTGFTLKTLAGTMTAAGFKTFAGIRRAKRYDLWIVASKSPTTKEHMSNLLKAVVQ